MSQENLSRPRVLDLFCGAGGASCGMWQAGAELVAGVDQKGSALETHAHNLPGDHINHDLADVDPSILPTADIDWVHGSPPCQGFSIARGKRDLDDPRNSLVFSFVDWLRELQPPVATMENVPGMVNITSNFMDRLMGAFRDAGYRVRWRKLNCADYGVPQTRRRIITVAVRDDLKPPGRWFPRPTHAKTETTTLDGRVLSEWETVDDAIGDLTGPVAEHRSQGDDNGTTGAIWRRGDSPAHTVTGQGSHAARADGGVVVENHVPQEHTEGAIERFREILSGERDAKGLSGRVAYRHDPSPTITADETAAVPPILPPNHNPPDEGREGVRRLTVRECARLQSFDDWFVFQGTKTEQYAQVGNAVPPRLQQHMTAKVREVLA